MAKILKAKKPEKCIGCELCVMEAQHQIKKVGLEGSLIRIFRDTSENREDVNFCVELDPRINELEVEKIKDICPSGVYEIEVENEHKR
jgi:hypothetical protein